MNNSDSNDIKRLNSRSNLHILNASIDMDRYKAIKDYIKIKFKLKDPLVTSFEAVDNVYIRERTEESQVRNKISLHNRFKSNNSERKAAIKEGTIGEMGDMLEIEELLGSNLGEMLKLRQFKLKCNK